MSMLLPYFDGQTGTRGILTHHREIKDVFIGTLKKKKKKDIFLDIDPFSMLFSATIT